MIAKSDVAVLVPIYNEARHIEQFLTELQSQGFYALVVDDGSSDNSASLIKPFKVDFKRFEENRGKGSVLCDGFKQLIQAGFKWVVIMDGDGQHDPAELEKFLKVAERDGADLVNGNRLHKPTGMSPLRWLTNWFMSIIISLFARQWIMDSQCGYKMISTAALQRMELKSRFFEIEDELLLEAADQGCKISSAPVKSCYGSEDSHIHPARDTLRFLHFVGQRVEKKFRKHKR